MWLYCFIECYYVLLWLILLLSNVVIKRGWNRFHRVVEVCVKDCRKQRQWPVLSLLSAGALLLGPAQYSSLSHQPYPAKVFRSQPHFHQTPNPLSTLPVYSLTFSLCLPMFQWSLSASLSFLVGWGPGCFRSPLEPNLCRLHFVSMGAGLYLSILHMVFPAYPPSFSCPSFSHLAMLGCPPIFFPSLFGSLPCFPLLILCLGLAGETLSSSVLPRWVQGWKHMPTPLCPLQLYLPCTDMDGSVPLVARFYIFKFAGASFILKFGLGQFSLHGNTCLNSLKRHFEYYPLFNLICGVIHLQKGFKSNFSSVLRRSIHASAYSEQLWSPHHQERCSKQTIFQHFLSLFGSLRSCFASFCFFFKCAFLLLLSDKKIK